jgi:LmbE family N-acetylglucosaminyl deacetylase
MNAWGLHAHFDDFEFVPAGLLAAWRRQWGERFRGRIVVCTDGRAGHHARTREETGRIRLLEQTAAAAAGNLEFNPLRLPNGEMAREACLLHSTDLLAALWRAIREFEPDYLVCPPMVASPLAGIHNDHQTVAEAERRVAYMINGPHAFTPECPAEETPSQPCRVPVILNAYDPYMSGSNDFDLAVDVEQEFELVAAMSWEHQSQIREWLPWVDRHDMPAPADLDEWRGILRARFQRIHRELGLEATRAAEFFMVTSWGIVPRYEQLLSDLPPMLGGARVEARLQALRARLARE